jgi:hypothetical protein
VKESLVKRFLHDILGIFPIIRYPLRHRKNLLLVTKNQVFESPHISALCGKHQYAIAAFIDISHMKLFHNLLPPGCFAQSADNSKQSNSRAKDERCQTGG